MYAEKLLLVKTVYTEESILFSSPVFLVFNTYGTVLTELYLVFCLLFSIVVTDDSIVLFHVRSPHKPFA